MDMAHAALHYAAKKHDGQRYGNFPYVVHPVEVAMAVQRYGASQEDVVGALLHDTVEDTDAFPDEIEGLFGARVRRVVEAVTFNEEVSYGDQILGMDPWGHVVKFFDSLYNFARLKGSGRPRAWQKQKARRYARNIVYLADKINVGNLTEAELEYVRQALQVAPDGWGGDA